MSNITEGILFEESGVLLKWNSSYTIALSTTGGTKYVKADRIIYHWGEHTILNGLKLNFQTILLGTQLSNVFKRFNSIEFWAIGDENAYKYFDIIRNHLENQFGPASAETTLYSDTSFEWFVNDVRLSLYLFEQHAYKLSFSISHKR